ncbi:hypothetical protein [Metabacillus endolithicus]|uniref:Uncharacterized protein n=1 Tax=Metabacillus endolithicus TaxID=1535204 RepID=A0ABW5BT88_9BACI|nr:hypothetical protein [Metabacillus endolithicus]UPG63818.1 hypothetical protein MVE64_01210 [Metabacillus endolithicus]
MKETSSVNEFDLMLNTINNLSEEDAKSLLKIIYGFVNTAITGEGGNEVKLEVINKISGIYKRIPELNDLRNKNSTIAD